MQPAFFVDIVIDIVIVIELTKPRCSSAANSAACKAATEATPHVLRVIGPEAVHRAAVEVAAGEALDEDLALEAQQHATLAVHLPAVQPHHHLSILLACTHTRQILSL